MSTVEIEALLTVLRYIGWGIGGLLVLAFAAWGYVCYLVSTDDPDIEDPR